MSALKFDGAKPRVDLIPVGIWRQVLSNGVYREVEDERYASALVAERALTCLDDYQCGDDCAPWSFFNFITVEDLYAAVEVLEFGAEKYDAWNWLEGMPHSKIVASCLRHCLSVYAGVVMDEESNLKQRGHIVCNMLFLAYYLSVSPTAFDDRPVALDNRPVVQEMV